jgi:hypothetical protein
LKAAGIQNPLVTVQGLEYNLETNKLSPQTLLLIQLLEKERLSVNIGGNENVAAGTIGYKIDLPVALHGGITYPWKNLGSLDFRIKPGIFAGFEIRF